MGDVRTFVDEAELGGEADVVVAVSVVVVVGVKLDDEAAFGRVEATLIGVRQLAAQLHARRLRLAHLRTLQVEEQSNVVSTPRTPSSKHDLNITRN